MSRILPADQAGQARAWEAPPVDQAARAAPRPSAPAPGGGVVMAGALDDLQREAWQEAYAVGLREGYEAGQRQVREQVGRLASLIDDLERPFAELDAEVENELTQLALALAKQLVRRELRIEPTQVIAIVREAISALPIAARDVRVHLHPEDAAIVRQYLAPTENERAWELVEDPVMMRGGCRIITATSRVDARLETRLGKLLSELLGGERAAEARGDRPPGAG